MYNTYITHEIKSLLLVSFYQTEFFLMTVWEPEKKSSAKSRDEVSDHTKSQS